MRLITRNTHKKQNIQIYAQKCNKPASPSEEKITKNVKKKQKTKQQSVRSAHKLVSYQVHEVTCGLSKKQI